jgi:hypothetical protein
VFPLSDFIFAGFTKSFEQADKVRRLSQRPLYPPFM